MPDLEWKVGELLELSGYYWKTCTLHAAVKLDIFTLLAESTVSAEVVSKKDGGTADGVDRLLNALCAMGLLAKTKDRYADTEPARRYLDRRSEDYIGYIILHHHHLVESWARLDAAVKTGHPVRTRTSHSTEQERESFLMGMHNLARQIAPRIAEMLDLENRGHLLDLGGGPGTYAIHFCRKYPRLTATVCDLPGSRPHAEKNIAAHELSDRVQFHDVDYLADDLPGQYDAAWLSHILHAEGPDACAMILKKTVSVLRPGGILLVHEFILADSMDSPLFPALFSLNMLIGTDAGRAYSEMQLKEMLRAAGCRNIERLEFKGPNDSGILAGEV